MSDILISRIVLHIIYIYSRFQLLNATWCNQSQRWMEENDDLRIFSLRSMHFSNTMQGRGWLICRRLYLIGSDEVKNSKKWNLKSMLPFGNFLIEESCDRYLKQSDSNSSSFHRYKTCRFSASLLHQGGRGNRQFGKRTIWR